MKSCNVILLGRAVMICIKYMYLSLTGCAPLGRLQYSTVEIHVYTSSYMYIGTGACSGDYEIP